MKFNLNNIFQLYGVVHKKTGNYMSFLDDNLELIPSWKNDKIDFKICDSEDFYDIYSEIKDSFDYGNKEEIDIIRYTTKASTKEIANKEGYDFTKHKSDLDYAIQNLCLLNKGTRNSIIYMMALYYNGHKVKREQAQENIYTMLANTPEELFNDSTSMAWKCKEVDKVIEKVYSNNLLLMDLKEVVLNAKVLEWIMDSCKTIKQMNIMLCHVYHRLKWGNEEGLYFLSQDTICQYTGTKKRDTVIKMNEELVKLGILEVVEKGRYLLENGMKKGIATTYKLTIPQELFDSKIATFTIKTKTIDFIKLSSKHLDKKTILKYIPKQTYSDNYK